MNLDKTLKCINKHSRFLITSHLNLEGDALGSELAFCHLLKKMGKSAFIINDDPVPNNYLFLSGSEKIINYDTAKKKSLNFDCFAILDCSDLKRCGRVQEMNIKNKVVLNIDHHISNQRFGDFNLVDANASSCSEIIYRIYKKTGVPLDKSAALYLYVGILTDTGSFRYSNTTAFVHKAASDLLKYNIDVPDIYRKIYQDIPIDEIRLLNKVLPKIKITANGRLAWIQLDRDVLRKHKNTYFDLTEYILSFARAIKDVEVCVLFKNNFEDKNEIRVNFRSQGHLDVNAIASFYGGGGHKTASGCSIIGEINQVRNRVLHRIKSLLK